MIPLLAFLFIDIWVLSLGTWLGVILWGPWVILWIYYLLKGRRARRG